MAKTSTVIRFGRDGLNILSGMNFVLFNGGTQPFANPDDLATGLASSKKIATYEPDMWLLDGNYKFATANTKIGYMSTTQLHTTASPLFTTVAFQFTLDQEYTLPSITLYFSEATGDWPTEIYVELIHTVGSPFFTDTIYPSGPTITITGPYTDVRVAKFTFLTSNKQSRFARVSGVDFGNVVYFTSANIKQAGLIEEIEPLSIELPSNAIEFALFSADGDFSIIDPQGIYAELQEKDPVDAIENINNEPFYLGRFYLDTWESVSENEAKFEGTDAVAQMENITFPGGLYSTNPAYTANYKDVADVIGEIMTAAGLEYDLDASLASIQLYGWLPYGSCRDALRKVCLAIGAYASCARSDLVKIRPIEMASDLVTYDYEITNAEKGLHSSLELTPFVTGVEIVAHNYVREIDIDPAFPPIDIVNEAVGTGDFLYVFNEPLHSPVPGGDDTTTATLTAFGDNYILLNVTGAGNLHWIGYQHRDTKREFSVYNETLPAGAAQYIIRIEEETLIGNHNAQDIAQRIYDYRQQRTFQKTKLFAPLAAVGDSALVDVQSGRQMAGIIEKMDTNITGGFLAKTEIVGVVVPLP